MRAHLVKDLEKMKREILAMGSMVEEATTKAINALVNRQADLAREVLQGDDAIDNKELEVEDMVLKIFALHQPVASDLRYLVAVLKVNNDLERMGDLAIHIANRALYLTKHPPIGTPARIDEMADLVKSQVRRSLDALIRGDAELARSVIAMDETVDEIHWETYRELLARMNSECEIIDLAFHTISAVRHLERIGDYATNIAEDVYFMVTGDVIRHQDEPDEGEDN